MGRKRTRPGKYVCFCIAGLIIVSSLGCAVPEKRDEGGEARTYSQLSRQLLSQGDYEGCLEAGEKVLSLSKHAPPADQALFTMGLAYAHEDNPGKDYKKSTDYFARLIQEHLQSPLRQQAQMWVQALQHIETLEKKRVVRYCQPQKKDRAAGRPPPKKDDAGPPPEKEQVAFRHLQSSQQLLARGDYEGCLSASEKVLASSHGASPGDEALFALGLVYADYANPKKDYNKSGDYFKRLIQEYPLSPLREQARIWVDVLQTIEKLTKVDIAVEEIKKRQIR